MSAEKAHLLGLIGLRALVECDPVEYERVSDLSKAELEDHIKLLLKSVRDVECRSLYRQVVELSDHAKGLNEAGLLLRQLYMTTSQRSQYESLVATRDLSSENDVLPSEIFLNEIQREGLQWPAEKRVRATLEALNDLVRYHKNEDVVVECLGEVANTLAEGDALIGTIAQIKRMLWQSCRSTLGLLGYELIPTASEDELWTAATKDLAADWLSNNSQSNTESVAAPAGRPKRTASKPVSKRRKSKESAPTSSLEQPDDPEKPK